MMSFWVITLRVMKESMREQGNLMITTSLSSKKETEEKTLKPEHILKNVKFLL